MKLKINKPAPTPAPKHPDADLVLLGKAVIVAETARLKTGARKDRVETAAAELGWTDAAVIAQARQLFGWHEDAAAFRCWMPLGALRDGQYFTTPPPEREAMRVERIGSDIKVCLPDGKTQCWSDAALAKPNASPTFTAPSKNDMDRTQSKAVARTERRRVEDTMTPEEAEAARKPVVIAAPKPKAAF